MSDAGDVLPDWGAWVPEGHEPEWYAAEERLADERARAMSTPAEQGPRSHECVICHFVAETDDIVFTNTVGCVCLRCYERHVGNEKPMPKSLRLEIQRIVNAL